MLRSKGTGVHPLGKWGRIWDTEQRYSNRYIPGEEGHCVGDGRPGRTVTPGSEPCWKRQIQTGNGLQLHTSSRMESYADLLGKLGRVYYTMIVSGRAWGDQSPVLLEGGPGLGGGGCAPRQQGRGTGTSGIEKLGTEENLPLSGRAELLSVCTDAQSFLVPKWCWWQQLRRGFAPSKLPWSRPQTSLMAVRRTLAAASTVVSQSLMETYTCGCGPMPERHGARCHGGVAEQIPCEPSAWELPVIWKLGRPDPSLLCDFQQLQRMVGTHFSHSFLFMVLAWASEASYQASPWRARPACPRISSA